MPDRILALRGEKMAQSLSQHWAGIITRELPTQDLKKFTEGATYGFEILLGKHRITAVADLDWPFSPISFYISRKHPKFGAPHIDHNGKLCLDPPGSSYSQKDPISLADFLSQAAFDLLEAPSDPQKNRREFVNEFLSYWVRDMPVCLKSLSLIRPQGPSRMIHLFRGKGLQIFAESEQDIKLWVDRYRPKSGPTKTTPAGFLWLEEGLEPSEYPKNARGVWKIAQRDPAVSPSILSHLATSPNFIQDILFGFNSDNGIALAAISLTKPKNFEVGFRKGRLPKRLAVSRFYGSKKTIAHVVWRIDHSWIHTRGGENNFAPMSEKKVIVIGCGSLGSGVINMLAKSGVGNITVIDSDTLTWDNTARHILGAQSVGKNKAKAMAEEINSQMPSILITPISTKWQQHYDQNQHFYENADLIISATADWAADSQLNFLARTNLKFPPVIFGWLEPHALAGHSLVVRDLGGCLSCLMDEYGRFSEALTNWPDDTLIRIPACGDHYQPYGFARLAQIQSLVATSALDQLMRPSVRTELSSLTAGRSEVESYGGFWTKTAINGMPSMSSGSIKHLVPSNTMCQLCK